MVATLAPSTPVLVGVGQFCERVGSPDYRALSAADIAAQAGLAACADALSPDALRAHIDAVATTRTFDDSRPGVPAFGTSSNFPRSVAQRLGLASALALWACVGGDTPQKLVADFAGRIARGEVRMALLAGGEAISTMRHLQRQGRTLDWSETPAGDVQDQGRQTEGLTTPYNQRHGLVGAPLSYALLEHARRVRLGRSRADYQDDMAALFAPFTDVAAANPYAAFAPRPQTAAHLADPGGRNRWIADPYRLNLVAKDQVNQGAAVLLTSVGLARELAIPPQRWIFLHGHAEVAEREIMQRQDLGQSPAARMASRAALAAAGIDASGCGYFDFYSCFPIAVSNVATDALGLRHDDPRGLTVTGGLPFFGGPGNNYSMHAIAAMAERLRRDPTAFGFIGANGGYLSKYAAGVYSARPRAWREPDSGALQAAIDALPAPAQAQRPEGPALVESFTIVFQNGEPVSAIVAARQREAGARLLAVTSPGDAATLHGLLQDEPVGRPIDVRSAGDLNTFGFATT